MFNDDTKLNIAVLSLLTGILLASANILLHWYYVTYIFPRTQLPEFEITIKVKK